MKKITNDILDLKLAKRNIKRLDSYINRRLDMRWLCIKDDCKFIWKVQLTIYLMD